MAPRRWHDLLVNDSGQALRWLPIIAVLPADSRYILLRNLTLTL
jgi:hypothetical protein